MSTQLILYPQNYLGQSNSVTVSSYNEFLVNGQAFIGLNSTPLWSEDDIDVGINAIQDYQNPNVLGDWYRYTTPGPVLGNVPAPTVSGGNLILHNDLANQGLTGVYQRISGLIVGAVYDIVINISNQVDNGIFKISTWDGLGPGNVGGINSSPWVVAQLPQYTHTFTAVSSTATIQLEYSLIATIGGNENLEVSSISIMQNAVSATLTYRNLADGQVICDLYEEEEIPLTLSIDDFKNVAEKVQSYSKDFNLPATKRNNQIFNNMFEITRDADNTLIFNPYVKTKCILKEDGFVLFEGYLRLINIKDKDGEISYNVNLYSEVIALADTLKELTFSDLDLTELEHSYNKVNIKATWGSTGLPLTNPLTDPNEFAGPVGATNTQVLKYPFIDWTHQYLVGGSGSGTSATVGNPELTSLEQAFRPCIQLKYLINKIFSDTNQFTYTSNFLDSPDFQRLFMDFNWGSDMAPNDILGSGRAKKSPTPTAYINGGTSGAWANLPTDTNNFTPEVGYTNGEAKFTALEDNTIYQVSIDYEVLIQGGSTTVSFRILYTDDSTGNTQVFSPINHTTAIMSHFTYITSINITMDTDDTLEIQGTETNYPVRCWVARIVANTTAAQTTSSSMLFPLRGELGQWDFLKGIMTMFNLITMVDESDANNILIEPYADIFIKNTNSGNTSDLSLASRSIEHDWTEKVDASQMELMPLTNLNKSTLFAFVEDEDDYVFRQYKNATSGHLYGSLEYKADAFTILDGTEEIIAEPFAATVSKAIDTGFPSFIVPSVYALNDEGTSEGFDNSPRIFYNNGIKDTGASYYIPPQNGLSSENQEKYLQFSHLTHLSPGAIFVWRRDFVFESVQMFPGVGPGTPVNNLFNLYWLPYFNELYNANTRVMKLRVNLTPSDISTFKLYDTVFIKNRVFRVNKIEYKPNELAKVEFILIP